MYYEITIFIADHDHLVYIPLIVSFEEQHVEAYMDELLVSKFLQPFAMTMVVLRNSCNGSWLPSLAISALTLMLNGVNVYR